LPPRAARWNAWRGPRSAPSKRMTWHDGHGKKKSEWIRSGLCFFSYLTSSDLSKLEIWI
jgi:hypothetical protein